MEVGKRLGAAALGLCLAVGSAIGAPAAATAAVGAQSALAPHVMVIVMENTAYSRAQGSPYILGNADAPFANHLITTYTSAHSWFGNEHTSMYDYYDLLAGTDLRGVAKPSRLHTFVDQLAGNHISWKAYMESMPSACYNGPDVGEYTKGHNPFTAFDTTSTSPQCDNVVPYAQAGMVSDLDQPSPPSFVWITPNQCDNMHSLCAPLNNTVKQGDDWLSATIPAVQATSWYADGGIILVTWDESVISDTTGLPATTDHGGQVATIVVGAGNNGTYTAPGDHFGTLHGLEDVYGVGCLPDPGSGYCQSVHGDISGALTPVTAMTGSISGLVTDAQNGDLLGGAVVACSCSGNSTTTDSHGSYSFSNIAPGIYDLTFSDASPPGYRTQTQSVTVASATNTLASASLTETGLVPPAVDGLVLDGFGDVQHFGSVASGLSGAPSWAGWNIARALTVRRDHVGGYVLDGWGGVHAFGGAPALSQTAFWPGWDIARGMVLASDDSGGYVLDGFGGVHPVGAAPPVVVTAYWPGWDIAVGIVVRSDARSGYVLDGYGGLHPFAATGTPMPPTVSSSGHYWPGWDIARGVSLSSDAGGYILDGWGGVHPFGTAPSVTAKGYQPGSDVARAISVYAGSPVAGYWLDSLGAVHTIGAATEAQVAPTDPGQGLARSLAVTR